MNYYLFMEVVTRNSIALELYDLQIQIVKY